MSTAPRVTVTEVRVLQGPTLYLTRPAIKIIADCPGYLSAGERTLRAIAKRLGMRGARPGAPDSEQRERAVMRLVAQVVRRITAAQALADTDPLDPRLIFDLASSYDSLGDLAEARR